MDTHTPRPDMPPPKQLPIAEKQPPKISTQRGVFELRELGRAQKQ